MKTEDQFPACLSITAPANPLCLWVLFSCGTVYRFTYDSDYQEIWTTLENLYVNGMERTELKPFPVSWRVREKYGVSWFAPLSLKCLYSHLDNFHLHSRVHFEKCTLPKTFGYKATTCSCFVDTEQRLQKVCVRKEDAYCIN